MVLQVRAPKLFSNNEKKKKGGAFIRDMKESIQENILIEVLNFLYTDAVDLESLSVSNILALNAVAYEYELKRLTWYLETHLKEIINLDSFFKIFKEASLSKQERIVNFCLEFAVKNHADIVGHQTGAKQLGIELFQELVAKTQGPVTPIILDASPPPSTLIQDFKQIYDKIDELEGDFTLFRLGKEIKTFVPFHRAFLAVASNELLVLVSQTPQAKTKSAPEHLLLGKDSKPSTEDISSDAFAALMKYLYYGETKLPANCAAELIGFCGDFKLSEFQSICLKTAGDNLSHDSALFTLAACYLPQIEAIKESALEVRNKALTFIADNIAECDLSKLTQFDSRISTDIVVTIHRKARKDKGLSIQEVVPPPLSSKPKKERGTVSEGTSSAEDSKSKESKSDKKKKK